MPTLLEQAAKMTAAAAETLERNLLKMPEEKLTWKPEKGARTVLHQVAECAVINKMAAGMLATHQIPADFREQMDAAFAHNDTRDKVIASLKEGTSALTAAIAAFPAENLDAEIPLPWGKHTAADVIFMPYWNMSYHEGQINYIQTLYEE